MVQLAVCADTVFLDLPFEERVKRIADAGFLVEFWGWQGRNLDVFSQNNIQVCGFSASGRGSLLHPDHVDAYVNDAIDSLPAAQKMGCGSMVIHEGELGENGKVVHLIEANPITRWITAYKGLKRLAQFAEAHGVTYNLEVLNTKVDHPGYVLNHVEDAVRLVREVGSPNIKVLMDIYHSEVDEGNVVDLIRAFHPYIGHYHVADVPGRHEPGTGSMNYRFIAEVLREVGYEGAVGLEAFPKADSVQALNSFRHAFQVG